MNYQDSFFSPTTITRHISEIEYFRYKQVSPIDLHHVLNQPQRNKSIKISKNKLPNDFFQKRQTRRASEQKKYFPQQYTQPLLPYNNIQSERLIYSHQKALLFTPIEAKKHENALKINSPAMFLNRKFETRQQPKRDIFEVQGYRKVTNTSKPAKRNLIDLVPPAYDEKMNDFMNYSTKVHLARKKEFTPLKRQAQTFLDPESEEIKQMKTARTTKQTQLKQANIKQNEIGAQMTITFYNSKSICLPPINRTNI